MATTEQQETRRRIAAHEREATLLRANAPAAEAAVRERQAAEHDHQAATLRDSLEAELHAERTANVAARDADKVTVRFVRDLAEAWIDGRRYQGRGPVKQRLGQSATPVSTVAQEVEVQPAEEQVIPRAHAEVLAGHGGHVEILGPVEAPKAEQREDV